MPMTETHKSAFLTKSRIRNEQYETHKIKLLKAPKSTQQIYTITTTPYLQTRKYT